MITYGAPFLLIQAHLEESTYAELLQWSLDLARTWSPSDKTNESFIAIDINLMHDGQIGGKERVNENRDCCSEAWMMKILGLSICADIMVGDDMRRGISRGQKNVLLPVQEKWRIATLNITDIFEIKPLSTSKPRLAICVCLTNMRTSLLIL
ncbi:Uncharacterized protein Fot_22092 [Forsythia ovata]|uniref:Uncharacterized protein n=1 Tax=Forsythia ovata TaxID=205694 RepID=A0ABD1UX36_9LAMI